MRCESGGIRLGWLGFASFLSSQWAEMDIPVLHNGRGGRAHSPTSSRTPALHTGKKLGLLTIQTPSHRSAKHSTPPFCTQKSSVYLRSCAHCYGVSEFKRGSRLYALVISAVEDCLREIVRAARNKRHMSHRREIKVQGNSKDRGLNRRIDLKSWSCMQT